MPVSTDDERISATPCRLCGMTLVELLVVVAIILMPVMLLFPAVQAARESARAAACRNNLRQMGTALSGHVMQYDAFPDGAAGWWRVGPPVWHEWGGSWIAAILPYAEEVNTFNAIRFGCAGSGAPDAAKPARVANQDCFGGFSAANGILYADSRVVPASVRDGLSNTTMVGEQSGFLVAADGSRVDAPSANTLGSLVGANADRSPGSTCTEWIDPNTCIRAHAVTTVRSRLGWQSHVPWAGTGTNGGYGPNTPIQSAHGAGANVARAGGSVRWLSDDIAHPAFLDLAIRDDGSGGAP